MFFKHALGPNGAGKTTLFKSMLGLTDFSGEILSDGQPVSSRCFGSLIEYPAFYSRLTVEENLNLHAQYLGLKQHCILVSSHNLTEIAAVTDVLIFIRGGKIIKIVKNDYNEKELEALYEDIMTSGQREDA